MKITVSCKERETVEIDIEPPFTREKFDAALPRDYIGFKNVTWYPSELGPSAATTVSLGGLVGPVGCVGLRGCIGPVGCAGPKVRTGPRSSSNPLALQTNYMIAQGVVDENANVLSSAFDEAIVKTVMKACNVSDEVAVKALKRFNGKVEPAIQSCLHGWDA